MTDSDVPFDGTVILSAGAKASVTPGRLAEILEVVQAALGSDLDTYRRDFERVVSESDREVFLVPAGHWDGVGEQLGLGGREIDAAQRAHSAQLKRLGSALGRRSEFETALEIREAVVIGTDN